MDQCIALWSPGSIIDWHYVVWGYCYIYVMSLILSSMYISQNKKKINERDRMADEQIKSHELCKRTDPSVAKPYTRQRLVFSFTLRSVYPPPENPPLPKA